MSNKKQTAVEILVDFLNKHCNPSVCDIDYSEFKLAILQAKELEKQQIQIAFNQATKILHKEQDITIKWVESNMSVEKRNKLISEIPKTGQQYYKDTYGE